LRSIHFSLFPDFSDILSFDGLDGGFTEYFLSVFPPAWGIFAKLQPPTPGDQPTDH